MCSCYLCNINKNATYLHVYSWCYNMKYKRSVLDMKSSYMVTIDVTDVISHDINNNVIDLDFCELCQATSR